MSAATSAPETADAVTLGKYRLLLKLGQGGTANVYLGALSGPSGFNKLVVLKVLKSELAHEEEFRQMFLEEARLAARLNHPNVVQTNEVFEVDSRPVIVMEYLEGQALSHILGEGRRKGLDVPLNVCLKIISEVLNGLHYAHELANYDGTPFKLVHRDVTPHNVFVGYDGRVSVLDFGIAKLQGASHETRAGVIKGKIRFMPREQILGKELDRRTDIFAVGVMLWEAASRSRIWHGMADVTIMHNVINNPVPSPKTVNPDVPEALERICMKALAFHKEQRYATAAELQADIDAFIERDSVSTRAIGKYVSTLFAETRASTRKLIEKHLNDIQLASASIALEEGPQSGAGTTPTQAGFATSSGNKTSGSRETPPRSGRRASLMMLMLLVPLAIGAWIQTKRHREMVTSPAIVSPPAAPLVLSVAPLPPSPPVANQEDQPRVIQVRIKTSPDGAQLYIDDKRVDSNPYVATASPDSAPHTIRATLKGFETETKVVLFDNDIDVRLTLSRSKSTSRASVPRAATSPESRTAPSSAAPAPNCNPPFTLDIDGIRRMKSECL